MDHRGSVSASLPELPCSMSDNPIYGDEEMDEETVNFISALYTVLGPLLPEVTRLQGHQDPPAHLMADMKAKLREMGSSVSDARKRLLRYNIYLKKRLARAVQERKALKEQQQQQLQQLRLQGEEGSEQLRQPSSALVQRGVRPETEPGKSGMGTEKYSQDIPLSESLRTKALERAHRRSMRLSDPRFATEGEASTAGLQESPEDRTRAFASPQGILQRSACRLDTLPPHPNFDRGQL